MKPLPRLATPQFWFVLVLFAALMALAHGAAEWRGVKDAKLAAALQARDATAWKGQEGEFPAPHSVLYYRIVFTIWAAVFLLTIALCFYALRRPTRPSNYWVLFWTFSYFAYLVHFYWAAGVMFGWDFALILNSKIGTNANPEMVVCNPIPDLILTFWWGIDVLLAWCVVSNPRWLRIERGAVSLFAFVAFFGACVLAAKAGIVVRVLGVVMVVSVVLAYAARIALRIMEPGSLGSLLYIGFFRILNRFRPWYRLPTWLAAANLGALREVLRAKNLHSTSRDIHDPTGRREVIPVTDPAGRTQPPPPDPAYLTARQADGYYEDLNDPEMGSGSKCDDAAPVPGVILASNPGARFGRNVPLRYAIPEAMPGILQPNPREISRRLLARDTFKPAKILNFLAAAWIQFETHDWFFHGQAITGNEFEVPIEPGDDWGPGPMRVRRTRPDPTRLPNDGNGPPTFVNAEGHWWDASQIYGSDLATVQRLRHVNNDPQQPLVPNGRIFTQQDGLPTDPATRRDMSGFTGNWWIGLTLLHTLFTLEHNAICDHLRQEYPTWSDDRVFETARLVNAGLMAKIHTIEWTPAILPNPALGIAMNANWWGLFGEGVKKTFGRISENEAFSGIPGSETNHHEAPFALTEEFVAVYRLHPLMRDDVDLRHIADGSLVGTIPLPELLGPLARAHILPASVVSLPLPKKATHVGTMADWIYSFGVCWPGAVTLRNYPNFLRKFPRPDNVGAPELIDLATIDVLRDRERGVPRYNLFRKLLHMPPARSFDQLCQDPVLAKELHSIYQGDINRVDLMVGMYAETPPPGFGFSDTAFRIFILMASRRLKSSRFFTTDFTPEVYSPAGMDWLSNNTMTSILLRHYPELAPALRGVANPFAPWRTVADSMHYQPYEERERTALVEG
jgi:hypothetical protein